MPHVTVPDILRPFQVSAPQVRVFEPVFKSGVREDTFQPLNISVYIPELKEHRVENPPTF